MDLDDMFADIANSMRTEDVLYGLSGALLPVVSLFEAAALVFPESEDVDDFSHLKNRMSEVRNIISVLQTAAGVAVDNNDDPRIVVAWKFGRPERLEVDPHLIAEYEQRYRRGESEALSDLLSLLNVVVVAAREDYRRDLFHRLEQLSDSEGGEC